MSTTHKIVLGVHDFDWLYQQAVDDETRTAVKRIIEVEQSYMQNKPVSTSNRLMELRLGDQVVWTHENTAHSIPFGYVQIFKLLDVILPSSFRGPFEGVIIDVGANEGHWSLYAHKHNPAARLIAVEPNPIAVDLLRRNFASNGLYSAEIVETAIGGNKGTVTFETIDNVTSLGSFEIDRSGRPWLTDDRIKKISVPCTTLDDLCATHNVPSIDLLKIDVEGAELAVIEGARRILPVVQRIEVEYGTGDHRAELLERLQSSGFRVLLDHSYSTGRGDLFLERS